MRGGDLRFEWGGNTCKQLIQLSVERHKLFFTASEFEGQYCRY